MLQLGKPVRIRDTAIGELPNGRSDRHTRHSFYLVIYSHSSVGEIRQGEISGRTTKHHPLGDSIDDHIDHCHGYSLPDELTGFNRDRFIFRLD